jgi:hypothetical protein
MNDEPTSDMKNLHHDAKGNLQKGRKSRIEEIKGSVEETIKYAEESLDYHYDIFLGKHIKTQVANVCYLLSRLEIAEKALNHIKEESEKGNSDDTVNIWQTSVRSLQQIRE